MSEERKTWFDPEWFDENFIRENNPEQLEEESDLMIINLPDGPNPFADMPNDELGQAQWLVKKFEPLLDQPEVIAAYGVPYSLIEKMVANAKSDIERLQQ